MEGLLFIGLLLALAGILVWAYRETLSEDALEEEFIRQQMLMDSDVRHIQKEDDDD